MTVSAQFAYSLSTLYPWKSNSRLNFQTRLQEVFEVSNLLATCYTATSGLQLINSGYCLCWLVLFSCTGGTLSRVGSGGGGGGGGGGGAKGVEAHPSSL